jgi:2-oxoglutarate dehydrogenase complex dehydrogenase (E1) component-like enzyme
VLFMPKAMLRSPISTIDELIGDSHFQLVIDDPTNPATADVKRVLLCSGKVYFSLSQAREKEGINDVAIVRVEQPYPFPAKEIKGVLEKYRNARQIFWVQEETKNRGCWSFMEDRVRELLPQGATLAYIGRDEAASPATGSHKMHEVEEHEILTHALDLKHRAAAKPSTAPATVAAVATSAPATAASPTAVSQ